MSEDSQPVGLKKEHTHERTHHAHMASNQSLTDTACFPKLKTYSVLGQTSLKKTNKHTPLRSTLKDQSQPSPRIQDHTVAAIEGRLDLGRWGRRRRRRRR